jgi:hypothetical protein
MYIKTTLTEGGKEVIITTATPDDLKQLNEFKALFNNMILGELDKTNAFF